MPTEKDFYEALIGAGFDMAQAAGIMGNAQNESAFNVEAVGDGGTSFGYLQWHEPGYPFAPSLVTGNVAQDFTNQITRTQDAARHVNMGGTAADVAGAWASQFERCVGCQPGGPQFISRQQNAERIFQQAKSGHWPAGGGGVPGGGGGGGKGGVSSPGIMQQLGIIWNLPFNFFESAADQVTGIVTATEDVAQAIAGINNFFVTITQLIAWWFVPSHIVRVFAFLLGAPLVGFGIFNLSRTGKDYNVQVAGFSVPASGGNLAPVLGIAEITFGSILLFIAFHNLPADVTDLPSLLTYIQGNVASPAPASPGPMPV